MAIQVPGHHGLEPWPSFFGFPRRAFPLTGGGPAGLARALPSLISFESTIHLSFGTGAGSNFGRALKSPGNTVTASGRGHEL